MKKFVFGTLLFLFAFASVQAQSRGTYDNGQKKYEGTVSKGKKVGEWVFFHDNGQKQREGVYSNGIPSGDWKEYYRNGQMKSEGRYVSSGGKAEKHGTWTTYHKKGSRKTEGDYRAGKPVGTWFEYNTLGIEIKKIQR